jgi:hypothetical protein
VLKADERLQALAHMQNHANVVFSAIFAFLAQIPPRETFSFLN